PRAILPAAAGVTAAIGLLAAEVKFDVARTWVRRLDALDPAALTTMYDDMAAQAASIVRGAAVAGTVTLARSVDARYVGQGYELTVPVPSGALDAAAPVRIRPAIVEERESTSVLPPGTSASVDEYASLIVTVERG